MAKGIKWIKFPNKDVILISFFELDRLWIVLWMEKYTFKNIKAFGFIQIMNEG